MMRRILHLDMDAFFVAVELLRRPELRGLPVVVGGRGVPSERGVVSTASYEARRYGVHSAMPLGIAHRRCPDCRFLPVDYPVYLKVSERIKAILREYSPAIEEAGVDEAYLDVSAVSDPVALARALKGRIHRETGLTASVGIAPNKLLAKLASDLEKPDGLTLLTETDLESRVWPLPVGRLLGVGPKTAQQLATLNVQTIGDLARLSEAALVEQFKNARGHYLYRAARGIDDSALETHWEAKSMGHQATFQHDTADRQAVGMALRELTEALVARLHNQRYHAGSVSVKVRYADFETHSHAAYLPVSSDEFNVLFDAAEACLQRFEWRKPVRLVGVTFGDLRRLDSR